MAKPSLAAVACLALCCVGCSVLQEATGGAQQMTQELLTKIAAGDYAAIREGMSGSLRERFQPPAVESAFGAVREETGVCDAVRILNFRSNVDTAGSRLTVSFAARCTLTAIQGALTWKTEEGVRKLESFSILRLLASSESVPSSETSGEVARSR